MTQRQRRSLYAALVWALLLFIMMIALPDPAPGSLDITPEQRAEIVGRWGR